MKKSIADQLNQLTPEMLTELGDLKKQEQQLLSQLGLVREKMTKLLTGDAPIRVPRDTSLADRLIESIKASGKEGITVPALAVTLGKSQPTIYTLINKLRGAHPQIMSEKDGARTIHRWVEKNQVGVAMTS